MRTRILLALVLGSIVLAPRLASLAPRPAPVMQFIRDINPYFVSLFCRGFGAGPDSCPSYFVPLGQDVAFLAFDPFNAFGLWRTDGTRSGTSIIRDVNDLYIYEIDPGNGVVFLIAHDRAGFYGRELWRSDGTLVGTTMITDINPGPADSLPNGSLALHHAGEMMFFSATDGVHGYELWKIEAGRPIPGTAPPPAPQLVKDILPGPGDGGPHNFVSAGATLFFIADGGTGYELWKSDGTAAGTVLVKDIAPGPESSFPRSLAPFGRSVLFSIANYGGADEALNGLWVSDGTEAGTLQLTVGLNTGDIIPAGSRAFVSAWTPETGHELWVTNGTVAGTDVIDAVPGPEGLQPSGWLAALGANLIFTPTNFTLTAGPFEPWISDGTVAGTRLIKDIEPGFNASGPRQFTEAGGLMFFSAIDTRHGDELWVTDGTAAGTRLVRDLYPGPGGSTPGFLRSIHGVLYLSADDGVRGFEPWKVTP